MGASTIVTSTPVSVAFGSAGAVAVGRIWKVSPLPVWSADTSAEAITYNTSSDQTRDVATFLGVPYAEQPVDLRRFAPPVLTLEPPVDPWDASQVGPVPYQSYVQEGGANGRPEWGNSKGNYNWEGYQTFESEACLTLNIWSPDVNDELPVLVYIHGGGWGVNSAISYASRGHRLALKGVVVVTVEYRLSTFGFLNVSDLAGEPTFNPNFAIEDVKTALAWVRANIGGFGGDTENVTIYGTSAGGACVQYLMGDPTASALFDKAFASSGGGNSPYTRALPSSANTLLEKASNRGGYVARARRFTQTMRAMGAARAHDGSGRTISEVFLEETESDALRLGPTPEMVMGFADAMERYTKRGVGDPTTTWVSTANVFPFEDGTFSGIGRRVSHILDSGSYWADKPYISLWAENEASLVTVGDLVADELAWGLGYETAAQLYADVTQYGSWSTLEQARVAFVHQVFGYPAWKLAKEHEGRGSSSWLAMFNYGYRTHSYDVTHFFGNVEWTVGMDDPYSPVEAKVLARNLRMADGLMQSLANFCHNGDPSSLHTYAGDFTGLFTSPLRFTWAKFGEPEQNVNLIGRQVSPFETLDIEAGLYSTMFTKYETHLGD